MGKRIEAKGNVITFLGVGWLNEMGPNNGVNEMGLNKYGGSKKRK